MSRPRSAQGLHRVRTNSQSHIESAISAIQQSESLARETAAASAGFVPGTGGFIGGPPVPSTSPIAASAVGVSRARGASVRHRKDPTLALWNGKRVRTNDRICKDVPPPAAHLPSEPEFWSYANPHAPRPSLPFLKAHFEAEGRLTEVQAMYIIDATTLILRDEPNIIKVGDGVTVCGDVHGQYYDLLKLFEVGGDPSKTPYLFLGDYVDRGAFGIECLLYLYVLKLHYPKSLYLLRGNHECRNLTEFFTFKAECLHKYSSKVYEACIRSFQALPLAALLDGRFLCLHGGIGPDMKTLADVEKVHRFQEPGMEGTLCDILWADPIEGYSRVPDPNEPALPRARRKGKGKGKGKSEYGGSGDEGELLPPGFVHNHIRGCSYFYTYSAVCEFLERNGLLSVIRGHEAQDAGYSMYRATPHSFPSLITIFSAPNYLDAYNNRAAVIKYIGQHITIRQFNASPHPYLLPGFMDAFTWSLPFVGAKITEMLLAILNCCTEEELEETTDEEEEAAMLEDHLTEEEMAQRHDAIKNKVLAVGRMARVFDLLREEAENVSELTFETPANADTVHDATLDVQMHKIRKSIHNFAEARKSDILNEHVPLARAESEGPYTNPNRAGRPAPPKNGSGTALGRAATWDAPMREGYGAGAPSLVVRRRSTTGDDTTTMIRRALEGDEDGELLRLAMRVSRPLGGRHAGRGEGRGGGARGVVRVDTAP